LDGPSVGPPWLLIAWLCAGALVLAGAVAVDARERGQSASLWFILALVFPPFGALAYLVLRAPREASAGQAAAAAPRPAAAARPEGPERAPAPRPAESAERGPAASPGPAAGASGAAEWRRDVGVLPAAPSVENLGVSAVPPRHSSRARRGVPPWLVGGLLALVVLVAGGGYLLTHLVPSLGEPAATPTVVPTAAPAAEAAPEAAAPEAAAEPTREPLTYTVEPGDSLGSIADQFGTTVDALLQANNLDDPDLLVVGQRLVVPQ